MKPISVILCILLCSCTQYDPLGNTINKPHYVKDIYCGKDYLCKGYYSKIDNTCIMKSITDRETQRHTIVQCSIKIGDEE